MNNKEFIQKCGNFIVDVSKKAKNIHTRMVEYQKQKKAKALVEKKKQEEEALAEKKKQEEEKIAKYDKAIKPLLALFNKKIFLDSNIWMNKSYNHFFIVLLELAQKYKTKIIILPSQIDEMENLKTNSSEDSAFLARLAFKRIEKFQKENCVIIEKLNSISDRNAYADKDFIQYFQNNRNSLHSSILITNDCALRVRLTAILNNNNISCSGDDIMSLMYIYYCKNPQMPRLFQSCDGSGGLNSYALVTCWVCRGRGKIYGDTCFDCHGAGKKTYDEGECPECDGKGCFFE